MSSEIASIRPLFLIMLEAVRQNDPYVCNEYLTGFAQAGALSGALSWDDFRLAIAVAMERSRPKDRD